jgi:hypothetical protein
MVVNHCTPEAEAQWPLLELWLGTLMRPVNFFSKRESRMSPLLALGVLLILQCVSARLIASYNLTGDLPSTAFDFVSIPFFVPSGTAEIHIEHASIDDPKHLNILDFGVMQPDQTFRGWGGGNKQRVVIGEFATTRSYLLGPLDTVRHNYVISQIDALISMVFHLFNARMPTGVPSLARPRSAIIPVPIES